MGKNKLFVKNYDVYADDDIDKDYRAILMADLHLSKLLNKNMINNINKYLDEKRDSIDFILMPGDLASSRFYLKGKCLDYLKTIMNSFSEAARAPIYASLGNHDVGLFGDKKEGLVKKKFNSLSENSNITTLDNQTIKFDKDVTISGVTPDNGIYEKKNYLENNGHILNDTLKLFDRLEGTYNIAMIHDPLCVYNASLVDSEHLLNFDLITSGHQHGSYMSSKRMEKNNDGYGYMGYFKNFRPYLKIPCCYGNYKLVRDTELVVTEGIRRFNGFVNGLIYTKPFITDVSIKQRKLVMNNER